MHSRRFPYRIDEITPELMTAALAEDRPGVRVAEVRVVEHAKCGDGIASTADRVALRLRYAPGHGADLPADMMLKTLLLNPKLRLGEPGIRVLARVVTALNAAPVGRRTARTLIFRLVAFYQQYFPHAPETMYVNELRFYRELRHLLDIEAPLAFGGDFDEDTGQFGILLEDLTRRDARFPNASTPIELGEITDLVRNLASLHAHFWESPRLEKDLAWVPKPCSGGMFEVFDGIGLELIRNEVASHPFKAEILRPLGLTLDQMWESLWKVQAIKQQGPQTLLHGDTHIGNTYLLPGGKGGLLDFQLMIRGRWCHDLTYLLITGLDPEVRRRQERELIAFYLDELKRNGVAEPPRLDDAFELHRLCVIWGLVIGWLITPPQNYGVAVTSAYLDKLVTAALDLESFSRVPA